MLINHTNPTITLHNFFKLLKIDSTLTGIDKELQLHPNYPSLLSIQDTLSKYKINNVAYKIENTVLSSIPTPFISYLRTNGGNFIIVNKIENSSVTYSLNNEIKLATLEDFCNRWKNVILIAETTEKSNEPNFQQNNKKERWQRIKIPCLLFLSAALIVLKALFQPHFNAAITTYFFVFSIFSIFGLFVSILLLWYEVDKANLALQKICTGFKNVNCNSVLNSKQAKLFGIISWSEVGFLYFASSYLLLCFQGSQALPLLTIFSIIVFPYTLFSIYYQWRVVKQWCVLCLWIQLILFSQFVTTIIYYSNNSSSLFNQVNLSIIVSFLMVGTFSLIWFFVKPLLIYKQQSKLKLQELNRLKYNPEVFFGLLKKQKNIGDSAKELGILVGDVSAKNTIVKVCNPYCGPCAKAHKSIDNLLLQVKNLKVQIIFTATNQKGDRKTNPVKHLLAIDSLSNKANTHKALDDWYLAKNKSYETFAEKYHLNGELENQVNKIELMDKWCNEVNITFTPTIFFNGYQLPEAYSIEDLQYFIEELNQDLD